MAKTNYPSTTLKPEQILDFNLQDGSRVRIVLQPKPDATGDKVAHVDLDCAQAGTSALTRVGNTGRPRTVFEAGVLAYQFAQKEAQRLGGVAIVGADLQGEEFLELADVQQIVGNSLPVKLF
ncbi:hypothetical protein IAG25_32845 [Caballeronia sp. EK]|uniref:hypothetical protein n=1 Tax=Caballeronia sp. EK TaxID=2767469 RepID=UPI0016558BF0|nr:hypothetical protein [Caballeronia sp. EK]MBC8641614.1 hypothetical protein [Caballeronia sp. EK]